MGEILSEIQSDLLNPKVDLPTILRKAKVLAHQLGSQDLASWVDKELDGYKEQSELPDYRIRPTAPSGTWTNGYYTYRNMPVRVSQIENEKLREHLTSFYVSEGIKTVEQYANRKDDGYFMFDADTTAFVNRDVTHQGYRYLDLHCSQSSHDFAQILDTVRTRLLNFLLKLSERWDPKKDAPAQNEIRSIFNLSIYNQQGDIMPVFDQRGQSVQYQYNAAGDINIGGVQSVEQLAGEINKLRGEIEKAKSSGIIREEAALEAQYALLEASREAAARKPDRSKFLDQIGKAKDVLKDVAALGGLVEALTEIAKTAIGLIS
jgi:hypothetical protein